MIWLCSSTARQGIISKVARVLQEAGWSPYPSFPELHQIVFRNEPNVYDNFRMPQGVTEGWEGSHVNDAALALFRQLLGRPAQLMIEVRSYHTWEEC